MIEFSIIKDYHHIVIELKFQSPKRKMQYISATATDGFVEVEGGRPVDISLGGFRSVRKGRADKERFGRGLKDKSKGVRRRRRESGPTEADKRAERKRRESKAVAMDRKAVTENRIGVVNDDGDDDDDDDPYIDLEDDGIIDIMYRCGYCGDDCGSTCPESNLNPPLSDDDLCYDCQPSHQPTRHRYDDGSSFFGIDTAACRDIYDDPYNRGYSAGYRAGYSAGYNLGYYY